MNKIETLPKVIEYKGVYYSINLHLNAWNNIVICYRSMFKVGGQFIDIFPYCVEPNHEPYTADIFAANDYSGLNQHIGNCKTLDACVEQISLSLERAISNGEILVSNFD